MADYAGTLSSSGAGEAVKDVKVEGDPLTSHPNPPSQSTSWTLDAVFNTDSTAFQQANDVVDALSHGDDIVMGRSLRRGRAPEHPCWELMQRFPQDNYMVCRLCGRSVMWVNTRTAMMHFKNSHPEIFDDLERSWQAKIQLRAEANRFSEESSLSLGSFEPLRKRGRTTEHPSWRYFTRINKKGANCKLCGVHVAYACSGNLMKHLKSRHVAEFVIAQKDWDDILKRKKQLCEIRLMASSVGTSGETSGEPPVYDVDDDDLDEATSDRASQNGTDYGDGDERSPIGEKELTSKENIEQESKGNAEASTSRCDSQSSSSLNATLESVLKGTATATNVDETLNKILTSLGVDRRGESYAQFAPPSPFARYSDVITRPERTVPPVARRIQSFLNALAEDLVSFPPEKSLLCMRQIRRYMDEKLLEKEGCTPSRSDDDASIL